MSASAPTGQWASPGDWALHRVEISTLYYQTTLKNIMRIMKEEHGFLATTRMYKHRFNAWGLRKNRATIAQGGGSCDSCIASAEKSQMPRQPERQHRNCQPGESVEVPPTQTICKVMRADHRSRRAEECIHNLRLYVLGLMSKRFWTEDLEQPSGSTEKLITWYHSSIVAQCALRCKRPRQAFQVIRPYFDDYQAILLSHDPRLFSSTLGLAVVLSVTGPELGAAALRFAAEVSKAVYGRSNPYATVYTILAAMDAAEQRSALGPLFEAYCQFVEDQLEPGSQPFYHAQKYRQATRLFVLRSDIDDSRRLINHVKVSKAIDSIAYSIAKDSRDPSESTELRRFNISEQIKSADQSLKIDEGSKASLSLPQRIKGEDDQGVSGSDSPGLSTHTTGSGHASLSELSALADTEMSFALIGRHNQATKTRQNFRLLLDQYCQQTSTHS